MELYFLLNAIMNIFYISKKLKTSNNLSLEEYVSLLNPFYFNNNLFSNVQVGGEDEDDTFGLKYYVKLFLRILAWLLFFCFFGPMAPWVLLTWHTFKRLILGYKIYFRQY